MTVSESNLSTCKDGHNLFFFASVESRYRTVDPVSWITGGTCRLNIYICRFGHTPQSTACLVLSEKLYVSISLSLRINIHIWAFWLALCARLREMLYYHFALQVHPAALRRVIWLIFSAVVEWTSTISYAKVFICFAAWHLLWRFQYRFA
jgi:hypothetical protein